MAPARIYDMETYTSHEAVAMEQVADNIEAVNVIKASLKSAVNSQTQDTAEKDKATFRQYDEACERVKNFYREQHEKQTVAYNLEARHNFHSKIRAEMTVWDAMEMLDTLVDESDPDTSLSQIHHLLQSAEAIRRDNKPRWMQLVGLIHDLGKLLCFFGAEGQWDVVGDTFPVGCAYDERIIYPETFKNNPDFHDKVYSTKFGIYSPNCGLDNVMLSWGHDEYLYNVVKTQSTLPKEGLAMIRYHSFYPWHSEGAYHHLMNEDDYKMLEAVKEFNPYDLYSKSDEVPNIQDLKVRLSPPCFLCFELQLTIFVLALLYRVDR